MLFRSPNPERKGKAKNVATKTRGMKEQGPPDYSTGKSADQTVIGPRTVGKVILDPEGTAREAGGRVLQKGMNAVKCAITKDPTYCNLAK